MSNEISELINGLNAVELAERADAAEQLAYLGEEARPAAVPLARAAGDPDETVREWAAAALEEMGPPDAADAAALAELLDGTAEAAYWAATLLGRLGAGAATSVARLEAVLDDNPSLAVRQRAAWALGKIGIAAKPAERSLRKASASDDPRLSRLASRSLAEINSR